MLLILIWLLAVILLLLNEQLTGTCLQSPLLLIHFGFTWN